MDEGNPTGPILYDHKHPIYSSHKIYCALCNGGQLQRDGGDFNGSCICPACKTLHLKSSMPHRAAAGGPPGVSYWITARIPPIEVPLPISWGAGLGVLRVDNIPWGTEEDDLRTIFGLFGFLDQSKLRIIRDMNNQNLTYGYVPFHEFHAADRARKTQCSVYSYFDKHKSCSEMCTNHLKLSWVSYGNHANLETDQYNCTCQENLQNHWLKLFGDAGNLPSHPQNVARLIPQDKLDFTRASSFKIDKSALLLRKLFSQAIQNKCLDEAEIRRDLTLFARFIHRIRIPKNNNGQSLGYGFVYFNTECDAEEANRFIEQGSKYWVDYARY